jgi:Co/Zn/Cd efflux system component
MAEHKHNHENKTMWVVLLTALTMVVEIIFGLTTKSMALLADGIHMGSHVFAIGLSWIAYILVRKTRRNDKFTGDADKILSLSGYTSGLMLLIFAMVILVEAVERIFNPQDIIYKQAILGLTAAMIWNVPFIDAIAAMISSFVIIKWSIGLLKDSGMVLLDISHNKKGGHHYQ